VVPSRGSHQRPPRTAAGAWPCHRWVRPPQFGTNRGAAQTGGPPPSPPAPSACAGRPAVHARGRTAARRGVDRWHPSRDPVRRRPMRRGGGDPIQERIASSRRRQGLSSRTKQPMRRGSAGGWSVLGRKSGATGYPRSDAACAWTGGGQAAGRRPVLGGLRARARANWRPARNGAATRPLRLAAEPGKDMEPSRRLAGGMTAGGGGAGPLRLAAAVFAIGSQLHGAPVPGQTLRSARKRLLSSAA